MAAYITALDAATRLEAYGLEVEPTDGDCLAASNQLDDMAPFIGSRYESDQERPFPRSTTLDVDIEGDMPESVLDWVSLTAFQLSTDESPAITSESAGGVSVTYARPKADRIERLKYSLITPYLRTTAVRR